MVNDVQSSLKTLKSLSATSFRNDDERFEVLREARALCSRLERPIDTVTRLLYEDPTYNFALHFAVQTSLFHHIRDTPKTTQELASSSSVDPVLLRRILRHLAAHAAIIEQEHDLWTATPLSKALAQPDGSGAVRRIANAAQLLNPGPAFLAQKEYRNPEDPRDTVFQQAFDCPGVTMMEHLQRTESAAQTEDFNHMMAFAARYRVSWMTICPPDDLVQGIGAGNDEVAFVDVGGGIGVHVGEFRNRFPRSVLPGRVVLQELPKVIEAASKRNEGNTPGRGSLDEVELQVHDFWTPQPVQGAKIYFMSRIFHDWPDVPSKKILGHIADAMRKGYSKLLIQDTVIPDTGCHPLLSGLDITMMAALAGKERLESEWEALMQSQGLRIVKIHTVPSNPSAVLEVEVA